MALDAGDAQLAALHSCSRTSLYYVKQGQPEKIYQAAKSKVDEPTIPSNTIFQSLIEPKTPNDETSTLPTIAECATHLELLQCFHKLRADVLKSTALDKSFGIIAKPETIVRKRYGRTTRTFKKKDLTFADRRKQKWPWFLDLAVVRFDKWLRLANDALKDPVKENVWGLILPPLGMLKMIAFCVLRTN